jgi:lipopolysaccharide transport system permease protein
MLVFVFVSFVFQIVPNANIWYAIPALLLYAVNAVWLSLFLNVLCLRYRDIPPMIASIVQIAFFVTPIIWKPELLGNRTAVMDFNVFYYFVEILRLPLLGQAPPDHAWLVIGGLAVFGWALALVTLGLNYRRIPYWL